MNKFILPVLVFFVVSTDARELVDQGEVTDCFAENHQQDTIRRYEFFPDGTVLDKDTSLVWQRCQEGQIYDNNKTPEDYTDDICQGDSYSPSTWQSVMQHAKAAQQKGWRLPNINELSSLVKNSCLYYTYKSYDDGLISAGSVALANSRYIFIYQAGKSYKSEISSTITDGGTQQFSIRVPTEKNGIWKYIRKDFPVNHILLVNSGSIHKKQIYTEAVLADILEWKPDAFGEAYYQIRNSGIRWVKDHE